MENENEAGIQQDDANIPPQNKEVDKPITFGNPDKYGYDKIKLTDADKKRLEDEANAVVGSE